MGPNLLFDKSFIQSLSENESVWLDRFYTSLINPLFYIESLADLKKTPRAGKTAEEELQILAEKTPHMGSMPCTYHKTLLINELLGGTVPLYGQLPLLGGRPVKFKGQSGIVYEVSPEVEAMERWGLGEFEKVEYIQASNWREAINQIDLKKSNTLLDLLNISDIKVTSFEKVKSISRNFVSANIKVYEKILLLFSFLGIEDTLYSKILGYWTQQGKPNLPSIFPYATFILELEIFFRIAIQSSLISAERKTNKIDLNYLYYLPFAHEFVSSDKLHKNITPHFLAPHQNFIWGPELKQDLAKINSHYHQFSEEEKEKGLHKFAPIPPTNFESIVSKSWDSFCRPDWRIPSFSSRKEKNMEADKNLVKHVNEMGEAPTLQNEQIDFDIKNPESITIKRHYKHKKGDWWQLPKNMKK